MGHFARRFARPAGEGFGRGKPHKSDLWSGTPCTPSGAADRFAQSAGLCWKGQLGCWVVGSLGCEVVGLFGCWVVGLLGCWVVRLLGCWVVGLLGCWIVRLLGCWVESKLQSQRLSRIPIIRRPDQTRKSCKSDPKMSSKWSKSAPKVIQKWSQEGPGEKSASDVEKNTYVQGSPPPKRWF